MKTKLSAFFVLFTICLSVALAFAGDKIISSPLPVNDQVILYPSGTDDPQPDTIFYDDGIGGFLLHGPNNMWSSMRFTPVDSFELRAAYIMVQNPFNVSGQAAAVCFANDGGPPSSTVLAGPDYMPNPPASGQWLYVEFTDPVIFGPMEEFHIAYGPAPAGTYPTAPGWWPHLDGAQTGNRNYMATTVNPQQLPTNWLPMTYGDYMIRAGGEYLNPFIDLENMNCFTDNKKFFNLPGTDITLKAVVENVGMTDIPTFTVHWDVQYEGVTVFTSDGAYGPVAQNQILSCASPDIWTPADVGMYEVTATISAPGDENNTNDTSMLEQYATDLNDMPYTYAYGTMTGNTSLNAWGISFNLPETPARLDSFSIVFNQSDPSAEITVYANDAFYGAPSTVLWETTTSVDTGLNMFYPPNLDIFEDMFTVAYDGDSPLSHDETGINSAENDSMMNSAWSYSAGWEKMYSGDWPFVVYLDTSSYVPPEPQIVLSDSVVYFEDVIPGDTSWFDLTVYNTGGGDDLILTMIIFNPPPGIFGVLGFVSNTHIAAGDSLILPLIFTPSETGDYQNFMGIFNNATFPIPLIVEVYGTCIVPAIDLTLTPENPPIIIPANGGSFNFNIAAVNNGTSPATFYVWTYATLPNGGQYGPLIFVTNFTLAAGASIDRDRTQAVPANASAGDYTYDAYMGIYPDEIWDEDHFDFTKSADSDGGLIIPDWNNWGESFEESMDETTLSIHPSSFIFHPSYPNPFNPTTAISYQLQAASYVELTIYDIQGREVA
ncbi:MAG: hypothetical protein HQ591_01375, partial [candidate division Zixibacteria bacterium]|nr:hypothetical protein [Candidatus Tariuqbacter arcticus]